jgi:hypothetical protein
LSLASVILQSFDEDEAGNDGAEYWLKLFEVADDEQLKIERWSPIYWNDPNDILKAQGQPDAICTLREWVQMGVDLARHDMAIVNEISTLARDAVQEVENHFDPIEELGIHPQIVESCEPVDVQIQPTMSLAQYARTHIEEYRLPYEPVSLPALPRSKCPHREITTKRISDEMLGFAKAAAGCRGQVLANGWCEYHAPSQQFLEMGAKLGYPEIALGPNKERFVSAGVVQWEAYAETTDPKFLKQDCTRLKVRYTL